MSAVYVPPPLNDAALQAAINHPVLVATKNWSMYESLASNSGAGGGTYRLSQYFPNACYNIQWVFTNSSLTSFAQGPESQTGNITVRAGFEYAGIIYPLFFPNGSRTATIEPGGYAVTLPCGVLLPAGAVGQIRTYVAGGTGLPQGGLSTPYAGDLSDMITPGNTDLSVATGTGSSYSNGFTSNNQAAFYGPMSTLGLLKNPTQIPSFVLLSDSIGRGHADESYSSSDTRTTLGWFQRALNNNYPYMQFATSGDAAFNFVKPQNANLRKTMIGLSKPKYAVIAYGANDFDISGSTVAQVKTNLTTMVSDLTAMGCKVIVCTITPETDPTGVSQSANSPNRTQINQWLRAGQPNVYDVLEMSDATSNARDSGIWTTPSYTVDGNHPSSSAHQAMAAVFSAKITAGKYK